MPKSLPLMCEVREAVQCGVYDARLREKACWGRRRRQGRGQVLYSGYRGGVDGERRRTEIRQCRCRRTTTARSVSSFLCLQRRRRCAEPCG